MDTKTRLATEKDLPQIADIAAEAFWEEIGDKRKAKEVFHERVVPRWRELLRDRSSVIAVAEANGNVAGFAILRWWFGWNGWLEAIAVKKELRGRGLGKSLMEFILRQAKHLGYRRVCFAIRRNDPVSKFYSKFGARFMGRIPDEELGELDLYYIEVR